MSRRSTHNADYNDTLGSEGRSATRAAIREGGTRWTLSGGRQPRPHLRGGAPAQGTSTRAKRHAPLAGAAEDRVRGDERGTKAQRRRTVGPQGTGARQDPEGNGEVAASRDPARDSLPMGKEPRDRLRLQVSRSDAGGGVDGSVGVRVGAPLRFQGDLHTAEGDHKVTTLRNLDEDKLPATEKPRGVCPACRCLGMTPAVGRGEPEASTYPTRKAWGPEGWGPEHLPKWERGGTFRELRKGLFAPPGKSQGIMRLLGESRKGARPPSCMVNHTRKHTVTWPCPASQPCVLNRCRPVFPDRG